MSPVFAVFAAILIVAQLALPRRLGFLPLIIAGCHLGNGEIVGDFTIGRSLIALGIGRAVFGGFFQWSSKNKLDLLFLLFGIMTILSALGHGQSPYNPWNARIGLVINICGTYLYGRAYLRGLEEFRIFTTAVPLLLAPLGIAMVLEQGSQRNLYYILGASSQYSMVRDGKVRAQGPFRHPILAGCAGATSLPFAYLIWRRRAVKTAIVGFGSCLAVTLGCASSGPLAAVAVTIAAAALWSWRTKLYLLRRAAMLFGLAFWVIKGRGPWYLMASIDLVGGSTGWHRAKLFDQGFVYLNEWWLAGTDYTRHWMASGVSWSPDHVDITNYYLHLGVMGGLPLTLGLVGFLVIGFGQIGRRMRELRAVNSPEEMVLWCAGAALAAHAISFVSISYFDQMYILFYLLLASITAITAPTEAAAAPAQAPAETPQPALQVSF